MELSFTRKIAVVQCLKLISDSLLITRCLYHWAIGLYSLPGAYTTGLLDSVLITRCLHHWAIGLSTHYQVLTPLGSVLITRCLHHWAIGLSTHYQVFTPLGYWTRYSLPGAYTTGLLDSTHYQVLTPLGYWTQYSLPGAYTTGLLDSVLITRCLHHWAIGHYSSVRWLHHWAIGLSTHQLGDYTTGLLDSVLITRWLHHWAIGLSTHYQVLTPLGYWTLLIS